MDDLILAGVRVLLVEDTPEHRVRALKSGFWDYPCKPVDTELLVTVVAGVVRSAASRPLWTTSMPGDPPAQTDPTDPPEPTDR